MTPLLPWDLLDRYFAGECTAEEYEQVRIAFGQAGSEGMELEAFVQDAAGANTVPVNQARRAALWQRLESGMPPVQSRVARKLPVFQPAISRARFSAYAALAAVAVALIGLVVYPKRASYESAEPASQYLTTTGQQATIELADGSVVQLAPGSHLAVAASEHGQHIMLTGEAFFTVSPNSKRTFDVQTGSTMTRVLGTAFGVRRYENEQHTQVSVASGKVAVNDAVLTIGDVGDASGNGAVRIRRDIAVSDLLSWTSGRVSIRNLPMREAVPVLQRWYGIEIRFGNSEIAELPLTSTMSTDASVGAVTSMLSAVLGVQTTRDGNVVTLH